MTDKDIKDLSPSNNWSSCNVDVGWPPTWEYVNCPCEALCDCGKFWWTLEYREGSFLLWRLPSRAASYGLCARARSMTKRRGRATKHTVAGTDGEGTLETEIRLALTESQAYRIVLALKWSEPELTAEIFGVLGRKQ